MTSALSRGIPVTLLASAARTTSSNTGTLTGSSVLPAAAAISLFMDVTANAGEHSSTTSPLQVFLDTSPDGGTTWFPVQRFAAISTSTASAVINFRPTGIGAVEAANGGILTATTSVTGSANNCVLTQTNRVRWVLGDNSGGLAHTATFAVFAIAQPMGATP